MKVRNGFVSNSSSSSYLIAFNNVNLEKLFTSEHNYGDGTYVSALGVQDVVDYFKDRFGIGIDDYYKWGSEEEMERHYSEQFAQFAGMISKIAKVIDNGEDIAMVNISYGDDEGYANLKHDSIKIVEDFS